MGWIGGPLKVRTHPLPPPGLACVMQDLKVVVLQRTVVSRFGCFVFEIWVLRFRVLGASFSSLGRSIFEFWVLRFRDLGALFSSFGCFVFELISSDVCSPTRKELHIPTRETRITRDMCSPTRETHIPR